MWLALILTMTPTLPFLALSATLVALVGCEPGEVAEPIPVEPSVQWIDSKLFDRYVFAFDSSEGDPIHGLGKWSGVRTYTRGSDGSIATLFDVVDSGTMTFQKCCYSDSVPKPYFNKFQAKVSIHSFQTMTGLDSVLAGGFQVLAIAGNAVAWSNTIQRSDCNWVSEFTLARDSLGYHTTCGAGWPWNSQALGLVFGISEGLLSLNRSNSGYKTGGAHSFSLTRIRE